MRKKKNLYVSFAVLLLSLFMVLEAHAAENPFGKLPKTVVSNSIVSCIAGKGCDYYTPLYSKKIKMKVTSSNKKVADVKIYDFPKSEDQKGYAKGFEVIRKGYGTANIKAEVTVGGKTYKKTFKFGFYKYVNPFSEFKVNGKKYTSKFNKLSKKAIKDESGKVLGYTSGIKLGNPTGKLSYKLKKGYKIDRISIFNPKTFGYKQIKNNQKIPKGYELSSIHYTDTQKKATGYLSFFEVKEYSFFLLYSGIKFWRGKARHRLCEAGRCLALFYFKGHTLFAKVLKHDFL